jgi:hypothetical protein
MELREEMDLPASDVGPGEETMMDLFGMKVFSDIGDVPFSRTGARRRRH